MTTLREAAQQALVALETALSDDQPYIERCKQTITALRAALAEPQMQPCAGRNCGSTNPNLHSAECFEDYEKSTGMNQWQGLTDEQINTSYEFWVMEQHDIIGFARSIEAKLRKKNACKAALAEPVQQGCDHCNHPLYAAIKCRVCGRVTEPVQEPVACEPQYANDDGWCEWVCPQPRGYLMQCCNCGLIHEVDSRVAKYQPRPSKEFEVVNDPDLQVQWRMKRRDDISPKRKPLTEDEIALIVADCSASAHRHDDFSFARAIERAHGIV